LWSVREVIQDRDPTTRQQITGYVRNQALNIGSRFGVIQQMRDEYQPESLPGFNAII
jgi:hypothetical protein